MSNVVSSGSANAKSRIKIGVIYTVTGIGQPNFDEDERLYGRVFGDPQEKKKYEQLFNCEFVPLDFHAPEITTMQSTGTNRIKDITTWLEKKFKDEGISGYIAPGNNFNIISPGHNPNLERAQMEEAAMVAAENVGIPFLGICGGQQRWVFTKAKNAAKEIIRKEIGANLDNRDKIHNAFKNLFQDSFLERSLQIKDLVISEFEKEQKSSPKLILDKKYVEDTLRRLNSKENRNYINKYFSEYFVKYLNDIEDALQKNTERDPQSCLNVNPDAFRNIFQKNNHTHFINYFRKTTPGAEIPSFYTRFDDIFEQYFKKYGEVNGIILINNARLLTGHNHCNDDGVNHIDTSTHVIALSGDSIYYKSLPERQRTGFDGEAYTASEHNQAVIINPLVKKLLRKAQVEITAMDSTENIIKAAESKKNHQQIAVQTHPENFSLYDKDLENCTNPIQKQRVLEGKEFAKNIMDNFISACRNFALGKTNEKAVPEKPSAYANFMKRPENFTSKICMEKVDGLGMRLFSC